MGAIPAATPRTLAGILVTWLLLNISWPTDWAMDPRLLALLSGIPQVVMIVLAIVVLRRAVFIVGRAALPTDDTSRSAAS